MRAYLYRAKERENYQSVYKEKLCNIIQSLSSTDETTAIVKHLEHVIKVKDNFVVLEDEILTKSVQLPQSLMETQ